MPLPALRVRNVQAGFYDSAGFHPLRRSADYDPDRAGDDYGARTDGSGVRRKRARRTAKAKARKRNAGWGKQSRERKRWSPGRVRLVGVPTRRIKKALWSKDKARFKYEEHRHTERNPFLHYGQKLKMGRQVFTVLLPIQEGKAIARTSPGGIETIWYDPGTMRVTDRTPLAQRISQVHSDIRKQIEEFAAGRRSGATYATHTHGLVGAYLRNPGYYRYTLWARVEGGKWSPVKAAHFKKDLAPHKRAGDVTTAYGKAPRGVPRWEAPGAEPNPSKRKTRKRVRVALRKYVSRALGKRNPSRWTISSIKAANRAADLYFFSKGATLFFNSKILPSVYQGSGGVYFVTGERMEQYMPYSYKVRQFHPDSGRVTTAKSDIGQEFLAKETAKDMAKGARSNPRGGRGGPRVYEVLIPAHGYDPTGRSRIDMIGPYRMTIRAKTKTTAKSEARRWCAKRWSRKIGQPQSHYRLPSGTQVQEVFK